MNSANNNTELNLKAVNPELSRARLFYIISTIFVIVDYLMPQYFGIHIGYDMTCTRIGNVIILCYLIYNKDCFNSFFYTIGKCKLTIPIAMYLFVALYTMIFRADVNALFMVFLEMLTLYMLIYIFRYVIGVRAGLIWTIRCAYFLGFEGILEYCYGKSIYHQFLSTVPNKVVDCYRSGQFRIMGPCGHPLGYGLLLILLLAVACIDIDKDRLYIFKRPFLLVLLLMNIFLTGSRSTLGIAMLELFLIFLFEDTVSKKKTILGGVIFVFAFSCILFCIHGTRIGQYILMQFASVIDQILGTEYAGNYGAELTRLEDSENYRKVLPQIFTLDWLHPLLGRGVKKGFSAEIDGWFIESLDNYYIVQYVKYAYPGLISYILFMLTTAFWMIHSIIKYKSGIMKAIFIGVVCYFINLWWLDALQTLKYTYILIALFFALKMVFDEKEDIEGNDN